MSVWPHASAPISINGHLAVERHVTHYCYCGPFGRCTQASTRRHLSRRRVWTRSAGTANGGCVSPRCPKNASVMLLWCGKWYAPASRDLGRLVLGPGYHPLDASVSNRWRADSTAVRRLACTHHLYFDRDWLPAAGWSNICWGRWYARTCRRWNASNTRRYRPDTYGNWGGTFSPGHVQLLTI